MLESLKAIAGKNAYAVLYTPKSKYVRNPPGNIASLFISEKEMRPDFSIKIQYNDFKIELN